MGHRRPQRIVWAPHYHTINPPTLSAHPSTHLCDTNWVEQLQHNPYAVDFYCLKEARITRGEETDHHARLRVEQARKLLKLKQDVQWFNSQIALKPLDFRNITGI